MISRKTQSGASVLTVAAQHGSIEFFAAVVTCLEEHVATETVRPNQAIIWVPFPTIKVMGGTWWSLLMSRATTVHRRTASIILIGYHFAANI